MKETFQIALEYLLYGNEITLNGNRYGIGEDENNVPVLCLISKNENDEDIFFEVDFTLNDFIKRCSLMTENERIGMVSSLALQKFKKQKSITNMP